MRWPSTTRSSAPSPGHGVPRVVVNCAGIAPAARTVSRSGPHDPALFARVVAVNLTGSFLVAAAFAARIAELDPPVVAGAAATANAA